MLEQNSLYFIEHEMLLSHRLFSLPPSFLSHTLPGIRPISLYIRPVCGLDLLRGVPPYGGRVGRPEIARGMLHHRSFSELLLIREQR